MKLKRPKKNVQDNFKRRMGLVADKPKINFGSGNDGITTRRFLENYEITE